MAQRLWRSPYSEMAARGTDSGAMAFDNGFSPWSHSLFLP
jgi:hypothetical protein